MKDTRLRLLAFPFGDYEGVRSYLDHLAREGWEFTGRASLLFGRFRPTQRKELVYDVVPADPRRSREALLLQVRRRQEAGWEPVETMWGMDIYKSLPCQSPPRFRTQHDYDHWRSIFLNWLLWSIAFLLVTAASLFALSRFSGFSFVQLSHGWYLSDRETALVLLLPLLAVLALLWLAWLGYCLVRRCKPHDAPPRWSLFFKAALQLLALVTVLLLPTVLCLSQIPRLRLRLALLVLILVLPVSCLFFAKEDRKRYILWLGTGVIALFVLTMVLGWVMEPVSYSTLLEGNRWRQDPEGLSIVTAESLEAADTPDFPLEDSHVTAFYRLDEALLVTRELYYEYWDSGLSMELSAYHPLFGGTSNLLWNDLLPEGAEDKGEYAVLHNGNWHQIWYRTGNTIYHLAGTIDWEAEELWPRAIAIAYANSQ